MMKHTMIGAMALAVGLGACSPAPTEDRIAAGERQSSTTADTTVAANAAAPAAGDTAAAGAIDKAFLEEAAKGDFGEVQIGKLAQERGTSQAVKDYGAMLVKDHGGHRDKLAALATKVGVTLPEAASAEGQKNYARLDALKGAAFDKEFGVLMRDDHKKDIAKYQKQAVQGPAETAALAKETIPVLQHHLEMASKL